MSVLDSDLHGDRRWSRVGDAYAVTKKPRDLDFNSVREIPFAAMDAIPQGGVYLPTFAVRAPDAIASGTYFERGDVLVAKITPSFENGKQAWIHELSAPFGYATTEVIPLHPLSDQHDPRVLFFYLLHPDVRHFITERMEGSTGRQRVPDNVLLDLRIPELLPREQEAIGNALEVVHSGIQQEWKTEKSAQVLKHATMRELFTRGLRGERERPTDFGLVPSSWSVEKLGDIAEIVYGAQAAVANATDPNIGTLILTNVNLNLDGHIDLDKRRYYKIPENHKERLSLRKGDVLFNWRSGSPDHVGKTVYFDLDGEFTYSSFILRFRPHKSVSNKYLYRWLTHLRVEGFFTNQRNVSSINSVYNASLSATIPIWFPNDDDQRVIVQILDAIDRKIELHKKKRGVLEELFKALLHKLMTGEIRVADLDLSALDKRAPAEAA